MPVVLPLLLGGAHAAVMFAATGWLMLVALYQWRTSDDPVSLGWVSRLLLVALGFTAIQLVPMPMGMLRWLSPTAYDLRSATGTTSWAPLSLEPTSTCLELCKLCMYLVGAHLSASLFVVGRSFNRLLGAMGLAGGLVMALGLVQRFAGIDRPYGAFGLPSGGVLTSSFINPNHLAGFLGLTAFCTAALFLRVQGPRRMLLILAHAAWLASGVVLSMSRGGILAFAIVGLCLGIWMLSARLDGGWLKRGTQIGTAAVGSILAVIAYPKVVHELWTLGGPRGLHKLDLWGTAPAMLADFPLLGIGRGALQAVYPHYQTVTDLFTLPYFENEALQTLVDWGPLPGLMVLAMAGICMVVAMRRGNGATGAPVVIAGLAFLGLHNLVDFNLALPAVALPAVMLLESLTLRGNPAPSRLTRRWRVSHAQVGWLGGAMAACCLLAAWPAIVHTLDKDTVRFAAVMDGSLPNGGPAAEALQRWHPVDYVMPLLVAEKQLSTAHGSPALALGAINRSMYIAPRFYGAHLLAGRALWRLRAFEQSLVEYRLACDAQPNFTVPIASEVIAQSGSDEAVAGLGLNSDAVSEILAYYLIGHDAAPVALQVVERAPGEFAKRDALRARCLLHMNQPETALAAAIEAQKISPRDPQVYIYEAEAHEMLHDIDAASSAFDRGIQVTHDADALLMPWAQMLLRQRDYVGAQNLAQRLSDRYIDPAQTALAHWLMGRIHELGNEPRDALRQYMFARDRLPQALSYHLDVARIYSSVGDRRSALRELRSARSYVGDSSALDRAINDLQANQLPGTTLLQQLD